MVIKETIEMPGFLPDTRTVHIYLPEDYRETQRYDVLYMFDGHNLFYDSDATYGKCWGIREYLDCHPEKLIVVGLECSHEGDERLNEYCPYAMKSPWSGERLSGKGKETLEFMVKALKPYIDGRFSTSPERKHTFIAGSSMGGLMSLYAVIHYQDVFGGGACLSPSFSICTRQLMRDIERAEDFKGTAVYLDMGTLEMRGRMAQVVERMLTLSHMMTVRGAVCYPRIVVGGGHNEATWEKQVPVFLDFLLRGQ